MVLTVLKISVATAVASVAQGRFLVSSNRTSSATRQAPLPFSEETCKEMFEAKLKTGGVVPPGQYVSGCLEEPQQWQSTAAVGPFPGTPVDPRLEPAGAILHQEGTEEGRLQDSAYKVFIPWFENECDSELHPHPHLPGLGIDEVKLEGLKVWNTQHKDRGGAGWIAVCPVKKPGQTNYEEKWFNVDTWKSWRLSFLLARLQRKVWEVSWTFRPVDLNEDKLIEVDGEKITPDALRRMAHQVAQSLQPGGMPGGLGLLLKGDVGEEPDAL